MRLEHASIIAVAIALGCGGPASNRKPENDPGTSLSLNAGSSPASYRRLTNIAIVDPLKVLNALAETNDINRTMAQDYDALRAQMRIRAERIRLLQDQRNQLNPMSIPWRKLDQLILQNKVAANAANEVSLKVFNERFLKESKRISSKIMKAIDTVAQEREISFVFNRLTQGVRHNPPEAEIKDWKPLAEQTLWETQSWGTSPLDTTNAVDLTQDVIAKLDTEYRVP